MFIKDFDLPSLAAAGAIYLIAAFLILQLPLSSASRIVLSLVNIAGTYFMFFASDGPLNFACYFAWVGICYLCMSLHHRMQLRLTYLVSLSAPIVWLLSCKLSFLPAWLGISYMSFRLSYLVYEYQIRRIELPPFWKYAGFAFFPLTLPIGPISPYSMYSKSVEEWRPFSFAEGNQSLSRILLGMAKYVVLSRLCGPLSLNADWFATKGNCHGILDILVASSCTYLNLYLQFSGACDIIIGCAGLLRIKAMENFNDPLFARNPQEFWQRFHISLYRYLHDIVFLPLSILFGRRIGAIHGTALAAFLTLLLAGLWHGFAWNFAILGVIHGLGIVVFFYFSRCVKYLNPQTQEYLKSSRALKVISTAGTFLYVSLSMIFFAYKIEEIPRVFQKFQLIW